MNKNLNKIKSDEAQLRLEGILWLSENVPSPTTQKLLIEALHKDESEVVRSLAVRLISLQKNTEYVPMLVHALSDDKSPLVRMEAAQGLGTFRAHEALPAMTEALLKESDVLVRLKILKSINYMMAKETVPELIQALDDAEPAVRFQALQLLEHFCEVKPGSDKESWKKWYEEHSPKS